MLYLNYYFSVLLLVCGAVLCEEDIGRRNVVPVIFVRGTHYDIGYDVGRTFRGLIEDFIANCDRLRQFEKEYKTEAGQEAYKKTLANLQDRYPYYVKEVQGIADGAKVPFYKLFLLQMDDIIETINENHVTRNDTGGCSSVGVNNRLGTFLGHTEDAFSETLNHFYILSAHVIPSAEDRENGAVEERFASLCYAGQLPGYTMGYNENGLVFSINTLSPRDLKPGNTPRTFITRALLSSKNFADAQRIFLDEGLGVANGFSMNMIWSDAESRRKLYNVEVAPNFKAKNSLLNIQEYEIDRPKALVHCNKYERISIPEVRGPIIDSSSARLSAIYAHAPPKTRKDIEDILSDTSGKEYSVFQNKPEPVIKTIAAGIFDLDQRTWSIFIDKPNASEPVAVIPISFSMLK